MPKSSKSVVEDLQFAQHPPIKRYPESSCLSKVDVALTSFLSNLPISAIPGLTFIPFLYGHLFGAPVVALVTFPPFMFSNDPIVRLYSLFMTVSWLMVFFYTKSRKVLTNPSFILPGMIGTVVLAVYLGGNALDTYCMYLSSWIYATVICFLGKTFFLRSRPAILRQKENNGQGGGYVRSSKRWSFFSEEHRTWPNSLHSFPSFDSAGAACAVTTMYLQNYYNQPEHIPLPYWLVTIVPLAAYGRIYFLAHHIVDVFCGTLVGVLCTSYVYFFRISSSTSSFPLLYSAQHHYDIIWLIICIIALGCFYAIPIKGPLFAMIIMSGSFIILPVTSMNSIVGTIWVGGMFWYIFNVQSYAHKQWVINTLEIFFKQFKIPPSDLLDGEQYPENLINLLEDKRNEFLLQSKTTNDSHPGNLYVIHQFRFSKRMQLMAEQGGRNLSNPKDDVYLVCGWHHLYELIEIRINHFFECTGTNSNDYDVVLGIYSGGAIIAPFVANILKFHKSGNKDINDKKKKTNYPICYMKCSRYKNCNMDPISLTKVTLDVALNRHDDQYKISKLPDKKVIENKRILMVDDASISGGTFRACSKYLLNELNAKSCRGVALCSFNGVSHVFDPKRNNEQLGPMRPQKLDVGTFTPWGTF